MSRKALVLDGLWYCLRPSFTARPLNCAKTPLLRGKRSSYFPGILAGSISASPRRCLSSNSAHALHGSRSIHQGNFRGSREYVLSDEDQGRHPSNEEDTPEHVAGTLPGTESVPTSPQRRRQPGVPKTLSDRPTSYLENRLQDITATNPNPNIVSATQILRILIRDRHVRPDARHYRALILANSDAERGSPEVVRQLLEEMEENGIPADSGTLHAAVQSLAVHPDYILRHEILHTLRDRWLPLSPAGWHYVAAGLVREHQFELALDHIENMERRDIEVEGWLYSMLIYYLCEFGEFDEIVRLMRRRVNQGHTMSKDLWRHVLDAASAASHHETTHYIWRQMVELGYLRPSYGVCQNVLTVASRTGDTELASSVIRLLAEIEMSLSSEDYEKVAEAHVVQGDLYSGFEVLCRMAAAGITLQPSSTRAILTYMIQERMQPRDAWAILKRLKSMDYAIPLKCAHVVLELCEHEALHDSSYVDEGVTLYKELYALCPDKADVSVFNTLVGMCRRAKNTDAGMFIIKEMASLRVVPNTLTFEHLILMCLDAGNSESAYMYFQDLLARGSGLSEDARIEIREQCSQLDGEYAQQLRHHPEVRGSQRETPGEYPSYSQTGSYDSPRESSGEFRKRTPRPVDKEARRAESKERRKRKRRRLAIARAQDEDDWMSYQPGGLVPDPIPGDEKKPSE